MNIIFDFNRRFTLIIQISGNATVRTLLKKYMDKLNLPYDNSVHKLSFLHNGFLINPFSDELISKKFRSNARILVFQKTQVIGGY